MAGAPVVARKDETATGETKLCIRNVIECLRLCQTYTTAGANGDLDRIPTRLAHLLQVKWPMGVFVVAPIDFQGGGVCRHLNTGRPVGVHLSIFVVETFQLQFQIRSTHERVVHGRLKLEYMIANCEVVFQAERW